MTALACHAPARAGRPPSRRAARRHRLVLGGAASAGAGRRPAGRAVSRDRLARDGRAGRARGSPRASAAALLELGGNNAAIVTPSADLELARARHRVRRGRHRRSALHHAAPPDRARHVADELVERLGAAYAALPSATRGAGHARRSADPRTAYRDMVRQRSSGPRPTAARSSVVSASRRRAPGGYYVAPAIVRMPRADRDRPRGDVRPDPLRADLRRPRRGDRAATTRCRRACRRRSSPPTCARPSGSCCRRLGLRDRQRQHRHLGRRDRRGVRRGEGDRRRPRVGVGRLEGLHAPRDQHGQLLHELPLAQGVKFGLKSELTKPIYDMSSI